MEKRYYIAYGSNLNVRQMRMRCPSARIIGTSVLKDYELLFKGSKTGSYLTVEKKSGVSVPVAVSVSLPTKSWKRRISSPSGKEWYSHELFYLQRPQFR